MTVTKDSSDGRGRDAGFRVAAALFLGAVLSSITAGSLDEEGACAGLCGDGGADVTVDARRGCEGSPDVPDGCAPPPSGRARSS